MIERFNRMAAQMLATFVKGNKRDCDEHLPYLMLAYRSTIHEIARCSPNMMMFGRDLALPGFNCRNSADYRHASMPCRVH